MAFSTDWNLQEIIPDILDFGIDNFIEEHARAQAELEREIRNRWWHRTGRDGEMDTSLLTESQWTKANAYLVLWKYALPKLTNWVDNDRFLQMIDFYRVRYGEEVEAVFADGVEYDFDEDGTVQNDEKLPKPLNRLDR
jgi:hypothetical protein